MVPFHYLPWVGTNYENNDLFGIKVLLVGESMYAAEPDSHTPETVQNLIRSIVAGTWRHRFYTVVRRTVAGIEDRTAFWHAVAFHNYVQSLVGSQPRQRPSEEAWALSRSAFVDVLQQHKPHVVLALGRELWGRWSGLGLVSVDKDGFGKLTDSLGTLATYINHPSSRGFSPLRWRDRVAELIARGKAMGG